MAFRLRKTEGIEEGVQRVIREQVTEAARAIHDRRAPADAIHGARKRLKEARAVLRLVRDGLGEAAYGRENRTYRDAARPLSDLRDADAIVEAFGDLLEKQPDGLGKRSLAGVREALSQWRAGIRTRVLRREGGLDAAAKRLARAQARLRGLEIEAPDWRAIRKGLARTYRRGRDAMSEVARDDSDENLHEWRKRAKDLRYQLEFLGQAWPGVMNAAAGEVHHLGDLLGDDHDLAVLRELFEEKLRTAIEEGDRQPLLRAIAHRRAALQSDAAELGRRVYAESPRRFVRRLREYWKAWR